MTDTTPDPEPASSPTSKPITAAHTRTLAIALANAFGSDTRAQRQWCVTALDLTPITGALVVGEGLGRLTEEEYAELLPQAKALPKAEHDPSPAPRVAASEPDPDEPTPAPTDATSDQPPPVQEAVRRVMYRIGRIGVGKTGVNREQGYNFRGIDGFVQALSPILASEGVILLPRVTSHVIQDFTTSRGNLQQQAVITVEWAIVGPAGDTLTAATVGQARDTADKATNKAMSAAFKYLLAQVFAVPNAGWDEQDFESPEAWRMAPATQAVDPPAQQQPDDSAERGALLGRVDTWAAEEGKTFDVFSERFRTSKGGITVEQLRAAPLSLLAGWVSAIEQWKATHPGD